MGAACSATALAKFKVLKAYFNSKECLTFMSVRGFLHGGRRGSGPPIIVMGENHVKNESDKTRKACATTLYAMRKVVSSCSEEVSPTSRVLFFVESPVSGEVNKLVFHPFFERFPDTSVPKFLIDAGYEKRRLNPPHPPYGKVPFVEGESGHEELVEYQPLDEYGKAERFSMRQVREHIKTYSAMFQKGFVPVQFDVFHPLRGFLLYSKELVDMSPRISVSFMLKKIVKPDLLMFFTSAALMMNDDSFTRDSIDRFDRHCEEIDEVTERQMNTHHLRDSELVAEYNAKFARGIELKYFPTCYKWMLHASRWIANFTMKLVDRNTTKERRGEDMLLMEEQITELIERQEKEAYPHHFLKTVSMCGDAITYILFVKARMSPRYAGDILVFYAGDVHAANFSRWLRKASYVTDFERFAEGAIIVP